MDPLSARINYKSYIYVNFVSFSKQLCSNLFLVS